MLENQNRFLENEFQRQLDKIVQEKNEQITRLTQHIDPTNHQNRTTHTSGMILYDLTQFLRRIFLETEDLLKKFMQQNVELQREIETLRAKLEHTFTFVNEKADQQKTEASSVSLLQTAFEQIRQTEMRLQELKFKSASQQEENDHLRSFVRIFFLNQIVIFE